jgi:hypothetical protein
MLWKLLIDATDYTFKKPLRSIFNSSVKKAITTCQNGYQEEANIYLLKVIWKKLKIFTARIKWIEAFGDYVRVVTVIAT